MYTLTIETWGAAGGGANGGLGGYAAGDLDVTPGEVLYVYVGGQDGFNGGGAAWHEQNLYGGGGTDVRQFNNAVANRVIVAGGGGSMGGQSDFTGGDGGSGTCGANYCGGTGGGGWSGAGSGGGLDGGVGITAIHSGGAGGAGFQSGGEGACQTKYPPMTCGGTGGLGQGGAGDAHDPVTGEGPNLVCLTGLGGTGGGGGGYYGGGGASAGWCGGGAGGGGSSWTGALSNATMSGGVRSGDGEVVITPRQFAFDLDQTIDGMPVTCSSVINNGSYTECQDLQVNGDYFPNGVNCGPMWSNSPSPYTDHAGFCESLTGSTTFEVYYTCSASVQRATWYAHVWGTTQDNGYSQHLRCYY